MVDVRGRDIISLAELSSEEIMHIIDLAGKLKQREYAQTFASQLQGKTLAMIFQKPSTRTRVSFEVAMKQIGGHAIYLSWNEIQLGRGETIADTANTLSRYVDAVMARLDRHKDIIELANYADIPVLNGLTDMYHPCQILADLLTIRERKGRLQGLKLAYVGDGNNICNTLLVGCAKVGINISVATPRGYRPNEESIDLAEKASEEAGSIVELTSEPKMAVKDADIVYTDVFVSMGKESEKRRRMKVFLPKYRVTEKLLSYAKADVRFMHCLPARRGEEVESEVIDSARSIVWDQAENRLYANKAILALVLQA